MSLRVHERRRRSHITTIPLMLLVCFILVLPSFALDPHRRLNQFGRQVGQTGEGLPQNTVHAVVQTRDGSIWLGTDDGLVRSNGNEFKIFTVENSLGLPGDAVEALTADSRGQLWVATTAGLAVYRQGQFRAITTADGLPDATVWFTMEDRRGRVWVATAGGLCVMEDMRCTSVAATRGFSVINAARFSNSPDGSIWLADGSEALHLDGIFLAQIDRLKTAGGAEILSQALTHEGQLLVGTREGLQTLRNGALTPTPLAGAERGSINAIAQSTDGSIWFATSVGLIRGTANSGKSQIVLPAATQTLFVDRKGTIWAGTARGVMRIEGDQVEGFSSGDALAGSSLLSVLEDREGNIWLGTEADGLTVLHEQKFTTYTTAEGLSGNLVRSVLQDAAGVVWIGTDGAGLNRKTSDGFVTFTTKDGLSSDVILSMASASNGDLWVGTPTGLNLVHPTVSDATHRSVVKVLTTADGLADDFIRSLLVDRAGNVWVGTRHGLTHKAADGTLTNFTTLDGLGSDFIGAMIETSNGDLWIGTGGGLTLFRAGKFTNFKLNGGLTKGAVTAMYEGSAGTLWLGTNGGGLSRMRDGVIVSVPAANLPLSITSILQDAEKRLWIGSRSGIYRVEEAALNRAIEQGSSSVALSTYDTSDGMRIRECSSGGHPAAFKMRDGSLWFATLRGVSTVDPKHLHENAVPPLMTIETVLVNDLPQHQPPGTELVLPPGSQRVEFQYAGLSFVAPQKVEYRYWLEGFDKYWVEAGSRRAAFYTNLRPGQYVFHVAAANNDGIWSESDATVHLRIKPFFWQTWWFYALLLVAATAIAYLIYARRVRRVQLMYQGVMDERSRIAREIHDTLAQGIVSISLQLEVVTRLMGSSIDAARAQLDETRSLVRQSLADARSSIWDLRAEGAEELPVRLGRSLKTSTGPRAIVGKLTVTGSYRAFSRADEDELLRIGQEAVTNAVCHGDCTEINVTLAYDMKTVRLTVKDNGRGFDTKAAGPVGHFGLQGMRERAARIHAHLEVISEVNAGTRVSVELAIS